MRGLFGWAQNCGDAPSPGLLRNPTSPRTRGEVKRQRIMRAARFLRKTRGAKRPDSSAQIQIL